MTENFPYALTHEQMVALRRQPIREEAAFACNAEQDDYVEVARMGTRGSGLAARGIVCVCEGATSTRIFLAAPELRQLAAALLNIADDVDGETRLNFQNPDAPTAETPEWVDRPWDEDEEPVEGDE